VNFDDRLPCKHDNGEIRRVRDRGRRDRVRRRFRRLPGGRLRQHRRVHQRVRPVDQLQSDRQQHRGKIFFFVFPVIPVRRKNKPPKTIVAYTTRDCFLVFYRLLFAVAHYNISLKCRARARACVELMMLCDVYDGRASKNVDTGAPDFLTMILQCNARVVLPVRNVFMPSNFRGREVDRDDDDDGNICVHECITARRLTDRPTSSSAAAAVWSFRFGLISTLNAGTVE